MFITLERNNMKSFVRLSDVSSFHKVVSGQRSEYTSYYLRTNNGFELEITEDGFEQLHNALIALQEELTEMVTGQLPSPSQSKPSEIGAFLTQLHKLLGGRGEAKLTTDRKARLTTRMKDFTKEELILAATNLGQDEFMQGANDNGKRYGTIDYLIRTSANINKWLEEQPDKKQTKMF